jgi:hypothetical protein
MPCYYIIVIMFLRGGGDYLIMENGQILMTYTTNLLLKQQNCKA